MWKYLVMPKFGTVGTYIKEEELLENLGFKISSPKIPSSCFLFQIP
jgi:hypothetical protein